ncbi:MAG: GDSL-type esterase/lipase family protein, partial [Clostridia bacterium]|nr:GDSL-type esterase/lipase family protein [Clostridia bacterium]
MKNILCYGDSNTFGYDPVTASRFDYEKRWTTLLNDMVKEKGYRVIEEGLNGRTTSLDDDRPDILPNRVGRSGLEYLPVILESHYPVDILVIMLGTNDCKKRYMSTGEKIAEGMEK